MSRAVTLDWAEDDPDLTPDAFEIDPVTAWSILYDGVRDAPGERLFYSLLDLPPPGAPRSEGSKLQSVLHLAGKQALRHAGLPLAAPEAGPRPRLFPLPLRSSALDPATPDIVRNPAGFAEVPLGAIRPLAGDHAFPPPPRVIVGIIDYGINILHGRFQIRRQDGAWQSRIAHAWLQDAPFRAPCAVPFGREVHGAEIATALDAAQGKDEAALRALGLMACDGSGSRAQARRVSHGTHVLDLAAGAMHPPQQGRGDAIDAAGMDVQIIAVALPDTVKRDSTGSQLGLFFVQGLDYILARSREIDAAAGGRSVPVVVNSSLGFSGGPRGGQHIIDRAIDSLLAGHARQKGDDAPDVWVVVPAGNCNLARVHAQSVGQDGGATLDLPWRLPPGDHSPNHLEAWITLPNTRSPPPVHLALTPPGDIPPPKPIELTPGQSRRLVRSRRVDGTELGTIGRVALFGEPDGRLRLSLTLAPTDPGGTARPVAAPGAWRLAVSVPGDRAQIQSWILRDDDPVGRTATARQSYFDAHDYALHDSRGAMLAADPPGSVSAVRRAGTLNAIATGRGRIVVAGYVQGEDTAPVRPAPYSATPLTGDDSAPPAEAITCAAPSETSQVLRGIPAAGTRSGSTVRMNGTSVAVPQVVRGLVAQLLAGTPTDPVALVRGRSHRPKTPPDPRLGHGPIAARDQLAARRRGGQPKT